MEGPSCGKDVFILPCSRMDSLRGGFLSVYALVNYKLGQIAAAYFRDFDLLGSNRIRLLTFCFYFLRIDCS